MPKEYKLTASRCLDVVHSKQRILEPLLIWINFDFMIDEECFFARTTLQILISSKFVNTGWVHEQTILEVHQS